MRNYSRQSLTLELPIQRESTTKSMTGGSWFVPKVTRQLVHELGSELGDSYIEDIFRVQPSFTPTDIKIRSVVKAQGARALHSAPYLASVRRREAGKIAKLVAVLPTRNASDDSFLSGSMNHWTEYAPS